MPTPGVYAFEQIDDSLPFVPLAARRVLDALGRKLSLDGWLSLALEDRRRLVGAGTTERVSDEAASIVDRAVPPAPRIAPAVEPAAASPSPELVAALGPARPVEARWRDLRSLDRYALAKCASRPEKLARA